MSIGTDAIRQYFSMIRGSGNKNAVQERHTIVLGDNAVVVTGFYEFTRMREGKPVPGPSRFTMLIVERDGECHIAHHHSSPHVLQQKWRRFADNGGPAGVRAFEPLRHHRNTQRDFGFTPKSLFS